MSFFSAVKNVVSRTFFRKSGSDCYESVAELVMNRQSQTKYYKNYSGFGKHDSIDFSDYGKKELARLISDSLSRDANLLDLALNPALPSMEFSLSSFYPMSIPEVSIERMTNNYEVRAKGRTIKVHEIGRAFVRMSAFDGYVQKVTKDKANLEVLITLFEDGLEVWPLPIVMNRSEFLESDKAVDDIVRSIGLVYFTIQFALKHRPTVFRDVTPRLISDANSKESKHEKPPVKVRRLILDRDEAEELLAGHYTVQHEYKCNAWGVAGHWRHYKNGKVVWVRPYVKGKDRNKPEAYTPKVYELLKEKGVS